MKTLCLNVLLMKVAGSKGLCQCNQSKVMISTQQKY